MHREPTGASGAGAVGGDVTVRAGGRDLTADDLIHLNHMTTVGHVLPNVAHELNNALQIVGGLVEMLSAREDLPQDVRDKVGRIGTQASRASTMIGELVGFTRHDGAGVRTVDLARIVEQALSMRRYHLSRARIRVTLEGLDRGRIAVRADGHALQQTFVNLLMNAEQGLSGRSDGTITIAAREHGDDVEIDVSDNGAGMPGEVAQQAPLAFFTTRAPAAGLGLTVAAALLERQGGRLVIRSQPGAGACCTMTLPKPRPTD
jgi:two-component system nitrogen regulation sensor histidine kinase NtrY